MPIYDIKHLSRTHHLLHLEFLKKDICRDKEEEDSELETNEFDWSLDEISNNESIIKHGAAKT